MSTLTEDQLDEIVAFTSELKRMAVEVDVDFDYYRVLHLKVRLTAFDRATWDSVIERTDDFAREHLGEFSVDLKVLISP